MIAPLCWTVWKSAIEMTYCVLFGGKNGKQGHCALEGPDRVGWLDIWLSTSGALGEMAPPYLVHS